MTRHPNIGVKVLVLWAPYLKGDSQANAVKAARYLTDERVRHFWDLWRFGTRVYSERFQCPPREAWDIYVLYKPESMWQETVPVEALWLHNRKLEVGVRYTKDTLEAGMLEWAR